MDIVNRSKRPATFASKLLGTVPPAHLRPPLPSAAGEASSQPMTAEAVRTKAKAVAAAITAKLPGGNRATRRALETAARAELRKNPVPKDPDCWLTPKKDIDKVLLALGIAAFTIDVASFGEGLSYVPALRHFTKDDPEGCGLEQTWAGGSVWMNCPYSEIEKWVAKADEAVRSGRVGIVVALLPSRVNAPWFAEHVAPRARVIFLRQRVRFYAELDQLGGHPKFGSMLCVWGGTPRAGRRAGGGVRHRLHRCPRTSARLRPRCLPLYRAGGRGGRARDGRGPAGWAGVHESHRPVHRRRLRVHRDGAGGLQDRLCERPLPGEAGDVLHQLPARPA